MTTKIQQAKVIHQFAAAEKLRAGVPLTIKDWCALEGVSREAWYQAVRRGDAPTHYRNGGLIRIAAADYSSWVEARKEARRRQEAAEAERAPEAA